jgi:hypothetical protein
MSRGALVNNDQYGVRPFTILKSSVQSQNKILHFVRMSEGCLAARAPRFASPVDQRLPLDSLGQPRCRSLVGLVPSQCAVLDITRLCPYGFSNTGITPVAIANYIQVLCSECLSFCRLFSSIPFETDLQLARIEVGHSRPQICLWLLSR